MMFFTPPVQATAAAHPSKAELQARLEQAQALLRKSSQEGFSFNEKTTYLEAVQHQPGLLQAWALTESEPWPTELAHLRTTIRLQLAWLLRDSQKMKAAWPGVSAVSEQHQPSEDMWGLLTAVHLGEWKTAANFGRAIQSKGFDMRAFHKAAIEDLSFFDYASVFDLVVGRNDLPGPTELADRAINLKQMEIRVNRVESHSATGKALADSAVQASAMKGNEGWIQRGDPTVGILQIGAAAHWIENPGQPPVSGCINPIHLLLRGEQSDETGRTVQVFDMHPSTSGRSGQWEGTCRVDVFLNSDNLGTTPTATLIYDYRWVMSSQESVPRVESPSVPGKQQ